MIKTIPLGPRLGLMFAEMGDKLDTVPDDALREVTDLLQYVDGAAMLQRFVAAIVSVVPMPEPIADHEPYEPEDHGRALEHVELITIDDERPALEAEVEAKREAAATVKPRRKRAPKPDPDGDDPIDPIVP